MLHGRHENDTIHDEIGMRHYYAEWGGDGWVLIPATLTASPRRQNRRRLSMASNGLDRVDAVRNAIYRSALLLDEGRGQEWLDTLCSVDFHYAVTTYSPEIRRDRDELAELVRLLPRHNSDHASLARHVGVYTVELSDEGDLAETVSVVAIYQTLLDGQNSHLEAGATRLLCTGKYYDRFSFPGERPVLQHRTLRLGTRQWGTGTHVIL